MASAPSPSPASGSAPAPASNSDKSNLVTRKEYEETLEELRRLKAAQQQRAAAPRRQTFSGLEESNGSSTCGRLCCCWASDCCAAVRRDAVTAYESFGKLLKRGEVIGIMAIMVFIVAWAVFIGGAVWSSTYYSDYYCSPALVNATNNNATLAPTQATSNGSKINVAGYVVPIPAEDNPCMPQNKPERRHFPMKLSHWIPGVIITLSYFCMCCFTFQDVTKLEVEMPGVNKQECDCCLVCIKSLLLMCTVAWASIGLLMAILYLILMISFVDLLGQDKKHIAVPTICVVIQCGLLIVGLILGFLAKWRMLVGAQEEDDENKLA